MSSTSARSTAWINLLLAVLVTAGCVSMDEKQCRTADWYQLGYRDGDTYGLRPQIDQYAQQCKAHGVEVAESRYLVGWVEGYREWNKRVMGSDCCAP